LIDQGELDWKILVLSQTQADKEGIRDHKDFEEAYPAKIKGVREWFRTIKTLDGKPENTFGYGGDVIGQEETFQIVEENQESYKRLIKGDVSKKFDFWLP
jgi:inorganic pyrophosphatase